MFAIGSTMAMSFLHSSYEWSGVGLVAALCSLCWIGSALHAGGSQAQRWIGRACWLFLIGCYALWAYLAVAFGVLLTWTVPGWMALSIAAIAVAAAATATRRRNRLHVPLVLPLGLWIAAVLAGWLREEVRVRCDDYFALQPPVQLVIATPPDLSSCRPGEVRMNGRFPRTIWQAPDGQRVVFTTQGLDTTGGLDGSVCEARLDGGSAPRCVGPPYNKSQGLIDLPERGRLLVVQWGIETPAGSLGSAIFELPRDEPISIVAEHWFDEMLAEGFYEPRNSTLYLFSDRMNGIHRIKLPSFERVPTLPSDLSIPGELRYNRETGEGVLCGHGIGAAIRGDPFTVRRFVDESSSPVDWFTESWGCDWDEAARKVYSTVPNLGLLDRIDYNTGRVEKRWFVGLGARSVAYDLGRRRVYMTDFLRGEVIAFDERSERVVERWFVGRFSRWVRLTHDGRALLATGNLGIVRISLDDTGQTAD